MKPLTREDRQAIRDKQQRFKMLIRNLRLAHERRPVSRPEGCVGKQYVLRRLKKERSDGT